MYPFKLTPAKTHVLYQDGSFFTYGLGPLYVVPVDGSTAPTNLTPGLIVRHFWISPDGATTVFGAAALHEQLYAVPSDGSQAAAALFPAAENIGTFGLASPTQVALIRYFAGFASQFWPSPPASRSRPMERASSTGGNPPG